MLPVKKSPVAFCFDDFEEDIPLEEIAYLEKQEALEIWSSRITQKSRHLYGDREIDNWISLSNWQNVGYWVHDYNAGNKEKVAMFLRKIWEQTALLYLIQSVNRILLLNPVSFEKYLDEVMLVCDDSPILIAKNITDGHALRFTSIGAVLQTHYKITFS